MILSYTPFEVLKRKTFWLSFILAGFPEQLLYSVRFKHESSGGEGVGEGESRRSRMATRDVIEKCRGIL